MQEEWKHWKTTYNKNGGIRTYEISSFGNVKINGNYFNPKPSKYYYIGWELIHRLVAKLFIPNPDNKPCIDHIDTNTHNNRVDNLRWVTYKENSNNPLTLKHTSESSKGRKHTEETRQKLSVSHKGKTLSEETKQKLSLMNKGKTLSAETKDKLRQSHIGKMVGKIWINNGIESKRIYPSDIENYQGYEIGRIDVNKGRKYSEESKQKISAANKGKGIGKIWVNNGIESKLIYPSDIENYQGYEIGRIDVNKGRKYSEETRQKMSLAHKGKGIGKIWVNNGIESKLIYPSDIDKYIGYVKGRCKK